MLLKRRVPLTKHCPCGRRGFVCSNETGGYTGGSLATGRVPQAGQASAEGPDEVCPATTRLNQYPFHNTLPLLYPNYLPYP